MVTLYELSLPSLLKAGQVVQRVVVHSHEMRVALPRVCEARAAPRARVRQHAGVHARVTGLEDTMPTYKQF